MSTHLDGVENFKSIETPYEKRQAAKAQERVSGSVGVPGSRAESTPLPGQKTPGDRVVRDEVALSPEAKAAQRAEADRSGPSADVVVRNSKPIGERYADAVVDRISDRLSGKKIDPEPTLLQRVYSSIRTAEGEGEDAPPTPSSSTVPAE